MKYRLIELLRCPHCQKPLSCTEFSSSKNNYALEMKEYLKGKNACSEFCGLNRVQIKNKAFDCASCYEIEIDEGMLSCECGRLYPIIDSIPRLLPDPLRMRILKEKHNDFLKKYADKFHSEICHNLDDISAVKKKTLDSFGFEWKKFSKMHDAYKEQFLTWITPLNSDFFKDKLVLDAGCGLARHTYYSSVFGAEVVGIDLSDAIDIARSNTRSLPRVHLIQADLYNLPLSQKFDFIYSIGVIHHLPDPENGFRVLLRHVKKNGHILVWLYGREHNTLMVNILDPARRHVLSKVPHSLLNILCYVPTSIWYSLLRMVYHPLNKYNSKFVNLLPYNSYFYQVSQFDFNHTQLIVFDLLSAPLANYYTKRDLRGWIERANLKNIALTWRNENSWIMFGEIGK
ncbi:MAG: methyltransferase domain-containing protein [Candidatus Methanoperedens sp.]|nr:methyltransferase domain-containing protein [Candidatus Methanoperedens sp.]